MADRYSTSFIRTSNQSDEGFAAHRYACHVEVGYSEDHASILHYSIFMRDCDNRVTGSQKQEITACSMSHYKFVLAVENTKVPGYVTEKVLEPLDAGKKVSKVVKGSHKMLISQSCVL